ncbi:MAG: NAD-dependent succinate-semialdehyde dehydrogenase [Cyclobacteriaceae bacterium]|nr:NAD-dependent succinate-semialdehyde dehydrogenase [Cyclobacteriaceae bacterium]
MSVQSINPYNNQVLQEFEAFSRARIEKSIETGDRIFKQWKHTPFHRRSALMMNAAGVLEKNKEALARTITLEMGKIKSEAVAEVEKCAWVCRYYAENAEDFLKDESLPVDKAESYIAYDPLGIVLAIMPWNFPFWQVFRFAAPNIMAGNVGLLKHASNVPQCAFNIEKVFIEAGFPDGVFQTLLIESDQVNDVIDDGRVKAVTLTGSEFAGMKVAERAGKNLKKTVLELGGSDPFIVLADADLENAVRTGVKARMINCGQSCIAAKRFILEEKIAEEYIHGYEALFTELNPGDPLDDNTQVAPMARNDLLEDLDKQVQKSVLKGAKVLYGGEKIGKIGNFYIPTILTDVHPGMPGFDEELFGPVASMIVVKDAEEAIHMANQSKFGLGSSLWTADLDKARNLAREIESGSVFVNSMVASHPKVPFGGVKASGYGRELSRVGIREFMNIKSVWIEF